jgi:SAM-dependent methyltransferase
MIVKNKHGSNRARFLSNKQFRPAGDLELVFSNGVFHHIPPEDRGAAADSIFSSLRPGGLFAFWENNPWNPGTRYVMSRIPFDKDAIMLSAREAQPLLRNQGFEILRTDFLFIFPRALHKLRWIEFYCSRLPFGAQYQVLCRKPVNRPTHLSVL